MTALSLYHAQKVQQIKVFGVLLQQTTENCFCLVQLSALMKRLGLCELCLIGIL